MKLTHCTGPRLDLYIFHGLIENRHELLGYHEMTRHWFMSIPTFPKASMPFSAPNKPFAMLRENYRETPELKLEKR